MLRKRSIPCGGDDDKTSPLSSLSQLPSHSPPLLPSMNHAHHHNNHYPNNWFPSTTAFLLFFGQRKWTWWVAVLLSVIALPSSILWMRSSPTGMALRTHNQRLQQTTSTTTTTSSNLDAIIVGSGLAGLTAALTIVDRGGRVMVLEKQVTLGGNSIRASSGINACCQTTQQDDPRDSLQLFIQDTTVSAGTTAQPALIETLVQHSASTLAWFQQRVQVPLEEVAQLGGHSVGRTHRPAQTGSMIGATLIDAMVKLLRDNYSDQCTIRTQAEVISLVTTDEQEGGIVTGVTYRLTGGTDKTLPHTVQAPQVILATGGFAADPQWIQRVRPELAGFGTTAGSFSTGDGLTLARTATTAAMIDLDLIQLHPTGFVDPKNPHRRSKVLAAEVLRGVGGIILSDQGRRVANELGLRSEVTRKMLEYADTSFQATGQWNVNQNPPVMNLVLSGTAAQKAQSHVDWYVGRGLLQRLHGLDDLAQHLRVPRHVLEQTLAEYRAYAQQGADPFGKTTFPDLLDDDNEAGVYYAGLVTPVLHYCMGGLKINTLGQVLNEHGVPIGGLYAIGETAGGVHGDNRLGGNSLLECGVFGRIVGKTVDISPFRLDEPVPGPEVAERHQHTRQGPLGMSPLRQISISEMKQHVSGETCWVALGDRVYDLTDFATQHAGGKDPIRLFCGKDATETFHRLHSSQVMERLADLPAVGLWAV